MYKILSVAESKLRKLEKQKRELEEDTPIIYRLIDDDGSVMFETTIPPKREWKCKK